MIKVYNWVSDECYYGLLWREWYLVAKRESFLEWVGLEYLWYKYKQWVLEIFLKWLKSNTSVNYHLLVKSDFDYKTLSPNLKICNGQVNNYGHMHLYIQGNWYTRNCVICPVWYNYPQTTNHPEKTLEPASCVRISVSLINWRYLCELLKLCGSVFSQEKLYKKCLIPRL